ncbi:MAG: phosphoesterase [Desulfuromonas sp.]|nr:MAG: phosphoesterase [Desulfuromonas sp.]
MIDWHCHILHELDDGAPSIDEAVAMARLLADNGYSHVCCTPHRLRGMYDTSPAAMRQKICELQVILKEEGIDLTLLAGMEYCLDEFFVEDFSSDPVTLGGTKMVLVETPANADPQLLRENIFHLVRSDCLPLLAHPERHAFLAPPARKSGSLFRFFAAGSNHAGTEKESLQETLLGELKLMGCLFQGNLGSVGGYYGSLVRQQEQRLRQAGLYHCYGSDGHTRASLESFLGDALATIRSELPEALAAGLDSSGP